MIGPAADHAGPPPAELGARCPDVRLAGNFPSADAGVELAERALGRGSATARRLVRPRQHRRVLGIVPRRTLLEHHHRLAVLAAHVGRRPTACPRPNDAHALYPGPAVLGWGARQP